jgi:pyridoxamine 5'-phosphate oxidase
MPQVAQGFDPDPIRQFNRWYADAARSGMKLPNAMTLASATRDGTPSARMVLFQGISGGGFLFFTNYRSRKAAAIAANPRAVLVFHWPRLQRQVVVEGIVRKTTRRESDRYFRSRPRGSRLAAWASPQSTEIPDRAFLDVRVDTLRRRYAGKEIPRPPFWGGFRLLPRRIEFWHGQPYRLHDRHCYTKNGRKWEVARLAP